MSFSFEPFQHFETLIQLFASNIEQEEVEESSWPVVVTVKKALLSKQSQELTKNKKKKAPKSKSQTNGNEPEKPILPPKILKKII